MPREGANVGPVGGLRSYVRGSTPSSRAACDLGLTSGQVPQIRVLTCPAVHPWRRGRALGAGGPDLPGDSGVSAEKSASQGLGYDGKCGQWLRADRGRAAYGLPTRSHATGDLGGPRQSSTEISTGIPVFQNTAIYHISLLRENTVIYNKVIRSRCVGIVAQDVSDTRCAWADATGRNLLQQL
ncbi:hypothetical protein Bbelb_366450 [Branchiostoma belcheri]|nr:hypothetical protein Bbelb_366450 [Branchiostoma belcheri]